MRAWWLYASVAAFALSSYLFYLDYYGGLFSSESGVYPNDPSLIAVLTVTPYALFVLGMATLGFYWHQSWGTFRPPEKVACSLLALLFVFLAFDAVIFGANSLQLPIAYVLLLGLVLLAFLRSL